MIWGYHYFRKHPHVTTIHQLMQLLESPECIPHVMDSHKFTNPIGQANISSPTEGHRSSATLRSPTSHDQSRAWQRTRRYSQQQYHITSMERFLLQRVPRKYMTWPFQELTWGKISHEYEIMWIADCFAQNMFFFEVWFTHPTVTPFPEKSALTRETGKI